MKEYEFLSVDSLVLEVTRRCNMHCAHCLRGDAECVDMQKETIEKLLPMLQSVSEVTFTGGEPTLNLDIIEYFFRRMKEVHGYTPAFFVATNGTGRDRQLRLCTILMEAYLDCEEKEGCGLAISEDMFHDEDDRCEIAKALTFYCTSKERLSNDHWVIAEGRALEHGYEPSSRDRMQLNPKPEISVYTSNTGEVRMDVELLYISAKEEVVGCCDLSYEDIAENCLCSLDELPAYAEKLYQEETADE